MLPFQIKQFTGRSGDEIVMLIDRGAGPAFWPNVFVVGQYVTPGRAIATQKRVFASIGMARMWAASVGRSLDDELSEGLLPSVADVSHLTDFLALTARSQEARFSENQTQSETASKMKRVEDFRPDIRKLRSSSVEIAPSDQIATRIRYLLKYIEWHLRRRLGELQRQGQDTYELRERGQDVINLLRKRIPPSSTDHDEISLEGIPETAIAALESVLHPDSLRNPFKNDFVRFRNYLAWRLYKDTGARRSEVRHAKVSRIDYGTRRFGIDVSKTTPRTVPLSEITIEAFDHFIETYWGRLPKDARARDYLFTDRRGDVLSERSFNRIFEAARKVDPAIPSFTTPHSIRRTWNDTFSRTVDHLPPDKKPSAEHEVQMRNRLMGWSQNSKMGAKYARRHIKKSADDIVEQMLRDSSTIEGNQDD